MKEGNHHKRNKFVLLTKDNIYKSLKDINIDSKESPFYGIMFNPDHSRWVVNAPKLEVKVESFSTRK